MLLLEWKDLIWPAQTVPISKTKVFIYCSYCNFWLHVWHKQEQMLKWSILAIFTRFEKSFLSSFTTIAKVLATSWQVDLGGQSHSKWNQVIESNGNYSRPCQMNCSADLFQRGITWLRNSVKIEPHRFCFLLTMSPSSKVKAIENGAKW